MKKLWYILSLLMFALVLVACQDEPTEEPIESDPTVIADTTAPLLLGVADIVVDRGDETFSLTAGITAIDDIDGTITSSIVVSGDFDIDVLGTYTITYTVSDAAGNQTSVTRIVIVRDKPTSELYLINGDFSEPITQGWTHWAGEGGTSTVAIIDGVLNYDITANGGQWWSNQFSQPNLKITQGKNYRLTFDAKSDLPRGMVVKLENSSYVGFLEVNVMMTSEWTTYEYDFFVTMNSVTNGKLIFGAGTTIGRLEDGNALTTIYLDNVLFTEIEPSDDETDPVITGATDSTISVGDAFDPLDGVTVSDNQDISLTPADIVVTGTVDINLPGDYVLTYSLTDASGNEVVVTRTITVVSGLVPSTWLILNGDFAEDQLAAIPQPAETGWGWHGTGVFTAQIKDGVAKIDIKDIGTVTYGVQFYLQNRVIVQGHIYRVTFDAKADLARPIQIALEEGITRRFDTIVDVTTEWTTYTIEFQHILPGYSNGKFAFFMGAVGSTSVPTTVYLDNITVETIEQIVDTNAPVLRGVDDMVIMKDFAFDPLKNITIFDAVDKELTAEDIVITGEVDVTTVGIYELTYAITDSSDLTATYTRHIEVKEAVDMMDSTFVLINGDMQIDQLVPIAQPAVTGWGWHGAGTFTVAIENGIMTQVVTNVGTVPHGTQFYQQNRVIETQAIYRVTYDAKVDIERSIRLSLESGTTVNWFEIVDITTTWASYESLIYVPASGFANGKFAFFVGLVEADSPATTFYLDNVEIELVGYVVDDKAPMMFGLEDTQIETGLPFDPLFNVKVFDLIDKSLTPASIVITGTVDTEVPGDYQLVYTLTDRQGNVVEQSRNVIVTETGGGLPTTFKITNGDFEIEQLTPATTGWGWHGNGGFTTEIKNGIAIIDVYEPWTLYYGTQFYQLNRSLTQGHIYQITFKARAEHPRPMQVNFETSGSGFAAYFDLTTEWTTYTYEYEHKTASVSNVKFGFFLGNIHDMSVPTTVYLDDIIVTRIIELSADTEVPQIWGANDINWKLGNAFDPMLGLRVYDHVDKTLTVEDITVSGTVNTDVAGDYTLTYGLIDETGNELIHTRIVTVLEEANFELSRIVFTDGDFTLETPITNLDSNLGWTLKAGGTTADKLGIWDPHTFVDGALRINVTNVATIPHSIQLFQKNSFKSEAGSTYLLTFRAKADLARDIRVSFEETSTWQVLTFQIIPLTTEWATYEVVLHNRLQSHPDVKIGFFLGLIETDKPERSALTAVYFDDVSIELIGHVKDDQAPRIYTTPATVVQSAAFNPLTGIKYGDFAKVPTVVVTSETAGLVTYNAETNVYTVDTSTVGTFTLIYTVTDVYGNETIHERTLTVTAP